MCPSVSCIGMVRSPKATLSLITAVERLPQSFWAPNAQGVWGGIEGGSGQGAYLRYVLYDFRLFSFNYMSTRARAVGKLRSPRSAGDRGERPRSASLRRPPPARGTQAQGSANYYFCFFS